MKKILIAILLIFLLILCTKLICDFFGLSFPPKFGPGYDKVVGPLPNSSQKLANPASVNCVKKGGTLEIKTNGTGEQYGLCMFEDNMACEEWALFRGDCPVGGIKTTGYDTIEQNYCAWIGGKTLAVPNATCALPDGKVCSDTAVYNGTCQ
jgi:putative hemolysin